MSTHDNNNNNTKPFWKSKRFWGLLTTAAGFLLYHYTNNPTTYTIIIIIIGLILTTYGSATATKKWTIKEHKKPKPTNWQKYFGCMKDVFPHHTADQVTEWMHAVLYGTGDEPILEEFRKTYFNDKNNKEIK